MRPPRWSLTPVAIFLAIEFLDELVFGVREAAWPAIRVDLGLGYAALGLLLAVPGLVASVLEPFLGLLGDSGWRRMIIVGGGCAFAAALLLVASAGSFPVLLLAFVVLYPASGAFVSRHPPGARCMSHANNIECYYLAT